MLIDSYIAYLEKERKYSLNTCLAYQKDLLEFQDFIQVEHNVTLQSVASSEVRTYLSSLNYAKKTASTVNRKLSSLKGFYQFLIKIGELEFSPVSSLTSLKNSKEPTIPLKNQEILDLLDIQPNAKLSKQDILVTKTLFFTGIRRNELINLKVADVNIQKRYILVTGKGNKQRITPLSDEVIDELGLFIEGRSSNEYVFKTKNGEKLYPKAVYNICGKIIRSISSKAKTNPHILRHTFATQLLRNGADLNSVKELLGHSSLASTQHYTHHNLENLKSTLINTHPRGKN